MTQPRREPGPRQRPGEAEERAGRAGQRRAARPGSPDARSQGPGARAAERGARGRLRAGRAAPGPSGGDRTLGQPSAGSGSRAASDTVAWQPRASISFPSKMCGVVC